MSSTSTDRRGVWPTTRRGRWCAVYTALFEDADYQRLSPNAKLVLLTARLGPHCGPLCIFSFYSEALERMTGLARPQLDTALRELETAPSRARPWVFRADGLLWIRNGLRFDPSISLGNQSHRPWIARLVGGLPRNELVRKFLRYYNLETASQPPSQGERESPSLRGSQILNQNHNQNQEPETPSARSSSLSLQGSGNGPGPGRTDPQRAIEELAKAAGKSEADLRREMDDLRARREREARP